MIPEYCITEWRQQVPWIADYQVEDEKMSCMNL